MYTSDAAVANWDDEARRWRLPSPIVQTGEMVDRRSERSLTLPEHGIGRDGMPFCEVSVMDQKREFATFAMSEGSNIRELCRRFGISPTTGYKWIERYPA